MSLRIERISHPDQLNESMQAQWNRLPMPTPMQSAEWLLNWWKTFRHPGRDQLCIILVIDGNSEGCADGDTLVGAAPWYVSHRWPQGRCLRFLGDGITCSDHTTVLVLDDYRQSVVDLIGEWLRNESGSGWHAIQFESIDEHDSIVANLVNSLEESGCELHHRDADGCWVVDLPKTWEEFLANLSKNHRKRCRRWQKTYFDTGRAEVRSTVVSGTETSPGNGVNDNVETGWLRIATLNQDRRNHLGDRSAFADGRFHQFHLSVLPGLIRNGRADLRELQIDGQPVASEYVLVDDRTVYCYQSGMKTNVIREGSGNLSILALFRDAIQLGRTQIDFLRGDEDYKQHWGARRVGCVDYHVASKSLTGSAHVAYFRTLDRVRAIRKSLIGATEC